MSELNYFLLFIVLAAMLYFNWVQMKINRHFHERIKQLESGERTK